MGDNMNQEPVQIYLVTELRDGRARNLVFWSRETVETARQLVLANDSDMFESFYEYAVLVYPRNAQPEEWFKATYQNGATTVEKSGAPKDALPQSMGL